MVVYIQCNTKRFYQLLILEKSICLLSGKLGIFSGLDISDACNIQVDQ
jgi:hypothetical protein